MMKKVFVNLIWILVFSAFLLSGEVIDISKTPLSKDSGRVVKLKKVLEISDKFYLPLPQVMETNDLKGKTITIDKKFIYTIERDDDENPILVKYMFENE